MAASCYFCGFDLPVPMYEDSEWAHAPGCPVRTALGKVYYRAGSPEIRRIINRIGEEEWEKILLEWYKQGGNAAGRIKAGY